MPLFTMKFNVREWDNTYNWLGKFQEVADNPDVMDVGVKYIGRDIMDIFNTEGSPRWAPLGLYTRLIREERGYGREHPIMVQSGALKDLAAGSLTAWGIGTSRFTGSDGDGTKMSAWTGQRAFTAKITGPKIENHFGGTMSGGGPARADMLGDNRPGHLPARPFFYLREGGAMLASVRINEKIMTDWAARSGKAKVK